MDNLDNLDPQDNQDPIDTSTSAPSSFTWKGRVGEDLANSPSLGKFLDTEDGLKNLSTSYANLEKLLGHEKVPIPKGPDDVAGLAVFNKAMGVPQTADGYQLPDVTLPGDMSKLAFDKNTFSQTMHEQGLTPRQAEGLWKKYTEMTVGVYQKHLQEYQNTVNATVNALRNEWGDAYGAKVELGEMVVAKFAKDKDEGDYLTSTLAKDPRGIRFLAKIGEQFSENKIGDFKHTNYAMSPEEAENEYNKIMMDQNHPYLNPKATEQDHQAAVMYVNKLIAVMSKKGKS
jgi:hypothetical protein